MCRSNIASCHTAEGCSIGDKTGIPSRALQGRTNQNNVIQNQAWKSKVNDDGWEVRTGCKNTWAVVIFRGQGARGKEQEDLRGGNAFFMRLKK